MPEKFRSVNGVKLSNDLKTVACEDKQAVSLSIEHCVLSMNIKNRSGFR